MNLLNLTKMLCAAPGPSGFEQPVFEVIREALSPFAQDIRTDPLGNLMAVKRCGQENARMVMLTAHMDEIGLIVTGAQDGFLRFQALGGVDKRLLAAREVRVLGEKPLFGVIDTIAPHLQDSQAEAATDIDKLFIDVGLTQEEALAAAPAGTPVVFTGPCEELGNGFLCGKALDDRSCTAIVLKAFEALCARDLNVDICCLFCTQEEVGHRGSTVGAYTLQPDVALIVDVTFARTPDAPEALCSAGQGAAIGIGPNMNRGVTQRLMDIATQNGIPWQPEAVPGGNSGTDAHAVQISREGVATVLISLPLKYMHTPVETVKLSDMEAIVRLVTEYVLQEGEE